MIVLVCGGRDFNDSDTIYEVLAMLNYRMPMTKIIHGGAKGADSWAESFAELFEIESKIYFAEWDRYGKAAGPIRNQRMLDEEEIDYVVAFPGNSGTADMIRRARAKNIPVIELKDER